MCAAVAGQRGRHVVVLDHNAQPGRKILSPVADAVTSPICIAQPRTFSQRILTSSSLPSLSTPPRHFLELVEQHNIPWHEKTLGQLFCDRSAHTILNMLLSECEQSGNVELVLNAHDIAIESAQAGFRVTSSQGEFIAEALVVANRRPVDPQVRRHRTVLRSRAPVWSCGCSATPRARATDPRRRRSCMDRARRRVNRSSCSGGPRAIPREAARHPSRSQRSGGAAGVELLAIRRAAHSRFPRPMSKYCLRCSRPVPAATFPPIARPCAVCCRSASPRILPTPIRRGAGLTPLSRPPSATCTVMSSPHRHRRIR